MDDFERSMARALKRVEVRAETMAKFLAIATEVQQESKRTGRMWVTPKTGGKVLVLRKPVFRVWVGSSIAAVLAVGIFAGEKVHERQQKKRAQQQFETAMRVTDHALDQTRAKLERAGFRLGN